MFCLNILFSLTLSISIQSTVDARLTIGVFSRIENVVGGGLLHFGGESSTSMTFTSRVWLLLNGPRPKSSTSS